MAIAWQKQKIEFLSPELSKGINISGLNPNNNFNETIEGNILIKPGGHRIVNQNKNIVSPIFPVVAEFYAPSPFSSETFVVHQPVNDVSFFKSFPISTKIIGIDSTDKVSIELRNLCNKWKTVPMEKVKAYEYKANVPADMVTPGIVNYRIMIKKSDGDTYTFPGGFKGDPYAWDEYRNESWQTFVASTQTPLQLFNATTDKNGVILYNTDWRNNSVEYITADKRGQLVLKTAMNKPAAQQIMGWQYFFSDKINGRVNELSTFTKLVVRARSMEGASVKFSLITDDAQAFATTLSVKKEFQEFEIVLPDLKKDSMLLLPRPYPGFLPLYFKSNSTKPFSITDAEKLEISFSSSSSTKPISIEVEAVWLKK